MSRDPVVSVVIPTWRGTRWIAATLASALGQTCSDIEVLVVDDASADGTADAARAVADPRVRVVENPKNLGLIGNWNRGIRLARGEFVKFLFQDDLLAPSCVERLLAAVRACPDAGMAFSRRTVLLDDPSDPASKTWWEQFAEVHAHYGPLPPCSPPRSLFEPWAKQRFFSNWIGEPTCVLLRRAALVRTGLFHRYLTQIADMEMWGRLAFHFAVAFVDEPLATFRVHAASTTRKNVGAARDWLDRLWMLEGLLEDGDIAAAHPEIRRWRRHEAKSVSRRSRERGLRDARFTPRHPAPGLREYARWCLARALRRATPLHPPLDSDRRTEPEQSAALEGWESRVDR